MTKAERIFKDTYYECKHHVNAWGFERNPDGRPIGFNSLSTDETTCRRTWNAIQKEIDSERNRLDLDEKYEILEPDRIEFLRFALEMVQVTLDNTIRKEKEFRESLKA